MLKCEGEPKKTGANRSDVIARIKQSLNGGITTKSISTQLELSKLFPEFDCYIRAAIDTESHLAGTYNQVQLAVFLSEGMHEGYC